MTPKIQIIFKDSLYLSRLYIDINICLKTVNDTISSNDFISENKLEYCKFLNETNTLKTKIPFDEKEQIQELHAIILCKVWDSFVLYLKLLIYAAEKERKSLSKNKAKKIDQYKFNEIKDELHVLRICPKDQPQWSELQSVKKLRDKYNHEHIMANYLKAFEFQSNEFITSKEHLSEEKIFEVSEYIISFSKIIDKEFLKTYSGSFI